MSVRPPAAPASVLDRLAAARRRITAGAVVRGVLVTLAVVGAGFLLALGAEASVWMGVGLRTAAFWTLVALALALTAWLVGAPLLRGIGLLPGLDERAVARRADADHAGVGDRLLAFLDLAEGRAGTAPSRLHDAAIAALGREVDGVPFERVRAYEPAKRALPWALVPALLIAALILVLPNTMGAAAGRLLSPGDAFAPPAPFALRVEPGTVELVRGADLAVRAIAEGRLLPATARLEVGRADERATETVRLRAGADGAFAHTVVGVRASLRYRVVAEGVASPWYTATAVARPLVRGVRVVLAPPGYSGRKARALPEGVGDATGLRGTGVRVRVALGGEPAARGWLRVAYAGGRVLKVPLRVDGETASGAFSLQGPGTYSVHLQTAAGVENVDPAVYQLGVLGDGPPQIVFTEGASAPLSGAPRRLGVRVTDDFGFSGGALVWRRIGRDGRSVGPVRRVRLPVRARPLDQDVAVDLAVPGLVPGDAVQFFAEVRDNGPGRQLARTPLVRLEVPSVADRFDRIDAQRDSTAKTLDALRENAERNRERFRQFRDDLRREPTPDWEDQRQVEQLQREQEALREQARQLQQQMQQLREQIQQSDLLDEDTQRQMEMMQRVMEELDAPELRDALQRLQEAMEKLNLRDMIRSAEEAAVDEEEFRRRLERAMELLQRLEAAVEMEEIARRAEDLAETEERLARQTDALQEGRDPDAAKDPDTPPSDAPGERPTSPEATRPDREQLADEQERAAEDAESLGEQMKELREQMEEIRNAPTDKMDQSLQQMQQSGGLPQQMQQNAQQMQRNQMQDAKEGQQQMARRLRQLARQMREQSQQMQSQQKKIDGAALRRALEDVLTLSREQEALANRTGRLPDRDPAHVPVARRQGELRDGLRTVVDTLRRVARTVPQLDSKIQGLAVDASREMEMALAQLADRRGLLSVGNQKTAMARLNGLALLLADVLDRMQSPPPGAGSGSGSGSGSSGGSLPQQIGEMGRRQAELNQRMQQMLNGAAGQRLGRSEGQRLRELAEQQEAIRRQLQRLLEGGGSGGSDGEGGAGGLNPADRSALQRIEDQMEEAGRQLRRGRLDPDVGPRQQQILQKLLETERSVNERGQDEKREAQTAGRARSAPGTTARPDAGRPADRVRQDLIRALESGYAPDYQDLIKRYFERLQGRVGG